MSSLRLRGAPLTEALAAALVAAYALLWTTGSLDDAVKIGALVPAGWTGDVGGGLIPTVLTPLSSAFLHANLLHLLLNTVILVFCGGAVERSRGHAALGLLLLVGAFAASVFQVALSPHSMVPVIGASGAISAVIAAYALVGGTSRARQLGPLPPSVVNALWLFAAWVGLNVVQGSLFKTMGLSLAVGAHIGGFAAGLMIIPFTKARRGQAR